MNIALPERQHPVVNLECCGHRNDEGGRGEEEAKIGIHPADVHVVSPYNKTQRANDDDCPDHHAITKNILARVDTDEVRHNAKRRQRYDVNLGVAKEPEQVLEQQRVTANVICFVTHGHDRRHKEASAQQYVQRHHNRAHEERREGEQREDGRDKNTPYRERHAH